MKRDKCILIIVLGAVLVLYGVLQLGLATADETAAILSIESSTYGGECGKFCDGETGEHYCEASAILAVCAEPPGCMGITGYGACSLEDGRKCLSSGNPYQDCEQYTDPCSGHRDVVYCTMDVHDPERFCIEVYGIPVECPGDVSLCEF